MTKFFLKEDKKTKRQKDKETKRDKKTKWQTPPPAPYLDCYSILPQGLYPHQRVLFHRTHPHPRPPRGRRSLDDAGRVRGGGR